MSKRMNLILVGCIFFSTIIYGQEAPKATKMVFPELKRNFNESGSHYIKATLVLQSWARYSDLNQGSLIFNTPKASYLDIGIRRIRFSAWSQLTDKLFIYTQFGQNNFNFLSPRNTGAFLHDAITEYKIIPQLHVGGGLTGWSGLSRYASPSVGSLLAMDAPLYQQTTNGVNDQFLRKLSFYAKGQINKLDYRVALTSPMAVQNATAPIPAISTNSNFSTEAPNLQTQAYLNWQFLDKENNNLPYTTGTYLGKKRIVNLGAGIIHQAAAMSRLNDVGDTLYSDMLQLGADLFIDLPLKTNGAAITSYLAFNSFDFGTNYLRNIGVMNPANGVNTNGTVNGPGVGVPMVGTGQTLYAQVGYKLRDNFVNEGTFQPYASIQYSQFQKLSDPMALYNIGINWLIHGTHNGKLSIDYQSRPIFRNDGTGELKAFSRKGMLVLQYQISL